MRNVCNLAALILCMSSGRAYADREIVYSARYYSPPTAHSRSYWHLYRISPDGRRRMQLTSARANDHTPRWSPDGKRILFVRAEPGGDNGSFWSDHQWLCSVNASGHGFRKLAELDSELPTDCRWLPDGKQIVVLPADWEEKPDIELVDARTGRRQILAGASWLAWSLDGRVRYIARPTGGDYIERLPHGGRIAVATHLHFPLFVDAKTIAGISGSQAGKDIRVVLIGTDGKEKSRKPLEFATYEESAINGDPDGLVAIPRNGSRLVYIANRHNSTTGIMEQFTLLDPYTGEGSEICYGQFISLSPDGRRYVTAPGRDLGPYGRRGGKERTVWVASLQAGRLASGKPRDIVSGTVWVVGADWRRGPAR